tara:strand:- start:133 stop:834 length:702 start_codon:yes stop_codon:yes gene_type:complete
MTGRNYKIRLFLEGAVIIASILLAFAIEAGWAEFRESQEASDLLQSIREDVVATQAEVAKQSGISEGLVIRARTLLDTLASSKSPDQLREGLLTLGSIFVYYSWSPVDHTYAEAVNSGRLQLIEEHNLRIELAQYEAQIQELTRVYASVEVQYYSQLEPFMVANTIYSEIAAESWSESLVVAPFNTDFEALARSRELWNLLTLRLELEVAVQSRIERMEKMTNQVLALLPPDS